MKFNFGKKHFFDTYDVVFTAGLERYIFVIKFSLLGEMFLSQQPGQVCSYPLYLTQCLVWGMGRGRERGKQLEVRAVHLSFQPSCCLVEGKEKRKEEHKARILHTHLICLERVCNNPQLCRYCPLWSPYPSRFCSPPKHTVVRKKASTH